MALQDELEKVAEYSREELAIVRKRAEENTAPRDHGEDYHRMLDLADKLDHHAHELRKLHSAEFGGDWRHESAGDPS